MALPFLPVVIVRTTYNNLRAVADPAVIPLFDYFNLQWLNATPLAMWNVSNSDTRTNNDLEGWHLRFKNIVGRHHPNIWQLLLKLQEEQAATEVCIQQVLAGQVVKRRRLAYTAVNRRIDELKAEYNQGAISAIDFLTGISHNLAELQA